MVSLWVLVMRTVGTHIYITLSFLLFFHIFLFCVVSSVRSLFSIFAPIRNEKQKPKGQKFDGRNIAQNKTWKENIRSVWSDEETLTILKLIHDTNMWFFFLHHLRFDLWLITSSPWEFCQTAFCQKHKEPQSLRRLKKSFTQETSGFFFLNYEPILTFRSLFGCV